MAKLAQSAVVSKNIKAKKAVFIGPSLVKNSSQRSQLGRDESPDSERDANGGAPLRDQLLLANCLLFGVAFQQLQRFDPVIVQRDSLVLFAHRLPDGVVLALQFFDGAAHLNRRDAQLGQLAREVVHLGGDVG